MHVIQTFWSPDNAEEVQIRGRTCRQDNPGSFRLILWEQDLQKCSKGGVLDPADAASVAAARVAYFASRRARMIEDMENAARLELGSEAFLQSLHRGTDYDKLVEFINTPPATDQKDEGAGKAGTVIVACDVSGSMASEGRIGEACAGFTDMVSVLKGRNCPDDRLTVYMFCDKVHLLEKERPVAEVDASQLAETLRRSVGGGTVCACMPRGRGLVAAGACVHAHGVRKHPIHPWS
jgi:hypothetical protein